MSENEILKQVMSDFARIEQARGAQKKEVLSDIRGSFSAKCLRILLNPDIVFHIDKKLFAKDIHLLPDRSFGSLMDVCAYLCSKTALSNQDVANVTAFIQRLDPSLHNFVRSFLQKTLKLGVAVKTYNECFPSDPITDVTCMLAKKYYEHQSVVAGKKFCVTEKLDGIRCLAYLRRGHTPRLYSRQNKPINGLFEIYSDLRNIQMAGWNDCVLDGELLISNRDGIPSKEQYKQTTKIVMSDSASKHGVTFHVFDVIPMHEFDAKHGTIPYGSRRMILDQMVVGMDHVKSVPILFCGTDTSLIDQLVREQVNCGHEGVMINLVDAPYVFGRTKNLLKVKMMQDADLRILGFKEGDGKFAGTLGALVVDWKGTEVGVGSGLSEDQRVEIWTNRDQYIGRIAKVRYFEETRDKDGTPSIRFPVFEEIREEGKEVSYN